MATVKRFEELEVWQRAEAQCDAFYTLVREGRFADHYALQDQMDRSSASVMDNIAEGFDRYSKNDFKHFLVISRGSNAEFRSQLYRAKKRGIIDASLFDSLKTASEHLGVKLHHFINYLIASEYKHKKDVIGRNEKPENIQEQQGLYNSPWNQLQQTEYPTEFFAPFES